MKPDYLFHYTSIESLAMILSTKKIRFKALNQVDDLTEGKCKDYKFIGDYFFISSWTDIEEESLPFWNMYTPEMKGVRIKMSTDLFNEYPIITHEGYGLAKGNYKSIISQNEIFKETYWIIPTENHYLSKVEYTDDFDKLYPTIETISGDKFTIHLNKIGSYKSTHWKFQSEWRYIIKILPITSKDPINLYKPELDILSDALYSMRKGDRLPLIDYFANINLSKFKDMEVLLGPKHSRADRIIVESLLKNYNPTGRLIISDLSRKIKNRYCC
jgi:hypothetical protein